jgi:hypothetical protein
MFGLSAAAIGGIAAGVGAIGGALISADAAGDAADMQAGTAANNNALQKYQYDTTRADNEPWRAAGQNALSRLTSLLNDGSLTSKFAGTNVLNEPGYAFGMEQGQRAIDNSASARGGIGGAALKAGSRFAQDYAGTKYNDAFNRFQTERQNTLDPLYRMAGFGSSANTANAAAGQNYANQAGANALYGASAQADAGVERGNIYGNMLNQGIALGNRNNWWQTPGQMDPYGGGYQYDNPMDLFPG